MNVVIIGANGGIGTALVRHYADDPSCRVFALARKNATSGETNVTPVEYEFEDEPSLERAARVCVDHGDIDVVINAVGMLHDDRARPEKSLRDISADAMAAYQFANCTCAALALKHFIPRLSRSRRAVFASLSARLGSISDNRLGGWYGYRASKAAHNMIIRTASIELARSHKLASVIGVHPGTVDTPLSRPYARNVPPTQLFSAPQAAMRICNLLQRIGPDDSGRVFDYDGRPVPA